MSCLQHWQSLLDRQGLHLPELMDGWTTLLFEIVLLPIINFSSIFWSDWRMCQCLLMIGPSGGSVLLHVTKSGLLCDLFVFWFGERFSLHGSGLVVSFLCYRFWIASLGKSADYLCTVS